MIKDRTCPHCNETFIQINPKVFSNRVRWCAKNPARNNTEGISNALMKRYEIKYGKFVEFDVYCEHCGKRYKTIEREHTFPSKANYFCSRSCANSRVHTTETKENISNGLMVFNSRKFKRDIRPEETICPICNRTYIIKQYKNKTCSRKCGRTLRFKNIDSSSLKYYRARCGFKFAINEFPDEFNFDLIRINGWYSAKNRGNNLSGISRDHMVSIRYGFDNNISPEIISHPANCQLVIHNENSKKHSKCSISLEELLNKIELWNKKYGPVA